MPTSNRTSWHMPCDTRAAGVLLQVRWFARRAAPPGAGRWCGSVRYCAAGRLKAAASGHLAWAAAPVLVAASNLCSGTRSTNNVTGGFPTLLIRPSAHGADSNSFLSGILGAVTQTDCLLKRRWVSNLGKRGDGGGDGGRCCCCCCRRALAS